MRFVKEQMGNVWVAVFTLAAVCAQAVSATEITNVTFDSHIVRRGEGDNWSTTWSDDGHQYTSCGDCDGFNGIKRGAEVIRIAGEPDNFVPTHLGFPHFVHGWYGFGIISVDGVLYHFVTFVERTEKPWRFKGAKLVYSEDHGKTWSRHDGVAGEVDVNVHNESTMFFWDPGEGWPFSLTAFLQYGKDNEFARDEYCYLYSPNGSDDLENLCLARVPNDKIRDRSAYEFFVKLDAEGNAVWTADISQRGFVYTFPENWVDYGHFPYAWHAHVTYNEPLGLYLMVSSGTGHNGTNLHREIACLGMYSATEPWGPWEEFYFTEKWITTDEGDRMYEPLISPKWINEDGTEVHLIFSDARDKWTTNYKLNIQKLTFGFRLDPASGRYRLTLPEPGGARAKPETAHGGRFFDMRGRALPRQVGFAGERPSGVFVQRKLPGSRLRVKAVAD